MFLQQPYVSAFGAGICTQYIAFYYSIKIEADVFKDKSRVLNLSGLLILLHEGTFEMSM